MSQWRWYVWCKTVKASKKRTKVLWSYQCPQYPVVQSAVVLIFAWLELESKNKHLFISLCGDVHIYVGNFFSKLNSAVSIAWDRGRARNILKETLALYVKHQIWKAELLTIEKKHTSPEILFQKCSMPQIPDDWKNVAGPNTFLGQKEEDDIFAKYSLFAHFSLEKHATQNFYVFELEKHPKVS